MKSNFIHVCFVIDESSSMYDSISDVKGGFKKIIDEQKNVENGSCAISVFRFSTDVNPDYILGVDVKNVSNELTYNPQGCTALYDGVGVAIDTVGNWLNNMREEDRPEKNLIVIMTDGMENNSKEYSVKRVRDMIKHQEKKYSWTFMYIGTDITNTKDADALGIKLKTASVRSKMSNSYNVVNEISGKYRSFAGDSSVRLASLSKDLNDYVIQNNAEYLADTGINIGSN